MILYDHSNEKARFLYEKAGFAVLSAYRSLEWEPWDSEFEDATQEAVATFWETWQRKENEEYSFVAARNETIHYLVGHNRPFRTLSLDYQEDGDEAPWLERLAVPDGERDAWDGSDWLSDADLEGLVTDLFTIPASREALEDYRRLLRHQMAGDTVQATAEALGKTYNATKALRRRLILKLAEHYDVSPTWEEVAVKMEQEPDFDGTVLAVSGAPPPTRTVEYKTAILRLLLKGYDTAAIAVELGRTEGAIKGARRDLKKSLTDYCRGLGIEPPKYNRNGGGWRPAHHYADMGGRPSCAAS
jgi:DNA-directed RNA polymerase specialized sigma24 family protein